jgi:hypothetical protein
MQVIVIPIWQFTRFMRKIGTARPQAKRQKRPRLRRHTGVDGTSSDCAIRRKLPPPSVIPKNMNNKIVHNSIPNRAARNLLQLALPAALLLASEGVRAAHPLVTEDTDVQGPGRTQIEFIAEFGRDRDGPHVNISDFLVVIAHGITDTVDLGLELPWQRIHERDNSAATTQRGINDAEIFAKWRFYQKDDLSFQLSPAIILATGDESQGLGAGRTGAALVFRAALEPAPWGYFFQAGFRWNKNRLDEREDLWHASFAVTRDIGPLKLAADIGIERNPDPSAGRDPAFALAGIIYTIRKGLDASFGYKFGLNEPEVDRTLLTGLTWRF